MIKLDYALGITEEETGKEGLEISMLLPEIESLLPLESTSI